MKHIPLHGRHGKGRFAIVDDGLYEELMRVRWTIVNPDGTSYVRGEVEGKETYMHRYVAGAEKGQYVDHKNRDTLDNRRENLRVCSQSENGGNSKKHWGKGGKKSFSKYKGVRYISRQCKNHWYAQIQVNKEPIYLGVYLTEEAAARAYDEAARRYFGGFARLNFPRTGEMGAL